MKTGALKETPESTESKTDCEEAVMIHSEEKQSKKTHQSEVRQTELGYIRRSTAKISRQQTRTSVNVDKLTLPY